MKLIVRISFFLLLVSLILLFESCYKTPEHILYEKNKEIVGFNTNYNSDIQTVHYKSKRKHLKFDLDNFHADFGFDTIINNYLILTSSCGIECEEYYICNLKTNNHIEIIRGVALDYENEIIANQDSNINIIKFSGDTIKVIPIDFYLSYYFVESIYIENNTFNFVAGDSIHYGTNKYKPHQIVSYKF